jgi:hypothetical protein
LGAALICARIAGPVATADVVKASKIVIVLPK